LINDGPKVVRGGFLVAHVTAVWRFSSSSYPLFEKKN